MKQYIYIYVYIMCVNVCLSLCVHHLEGDIVENGEGHAGDGVEAGRGRGSGRKETAGGGPESRVVILAFGGEAEGGSVQSGKE